MSILYCCRLTDSASQYASSKGMSNRKANQFAVFMEKNFRHLITINKCILKLRNSAQNINSILTWVLTSMSRLVQLHMSATKRKPAIGLSMFS